MKHLIALASIVILFQITLSAQAKYSYGFQVQVSMNQFILGDKAFGTPDSFEEEVFNEFGYKAGLQFNYHLNDKLLLRSGLNYSNSIYKYEVDGLILGTDVPLGTTTKFSHTLQNQSLELPVEFAYQILGHQPCNLMIGAGLSYQLNLNTDSEYRFILESIEDETINGSGDVLDFKPFGMKLFLGTEFKFGDSIVVGIEPSLNYPLHQFTFEVVQRKATSIEAALSLRVSII